MITLRPIVPSSLIYHHYTLRRETIGMTTSLGKTLSFYVLNGGLIHTEVTFTCKGEKPICRSKTIYSWIQKYLLISSN